jgi:hypothetical protein
MKCIPGYSPNVMLRSIYVRCNRSMLAFLGCCLCSGNNLKKKWEKKLKFTGVSKRSMRMFRLNGFEFLLDSDAL